MSDDDEYAALGDEGEESGPSHHWLISLADMSMLLMSFFILLFSMSSVDSQKFSESVSSVKSALGGKDKGVTMAPISSGDMSVLVEQAKLKQRIIGEQRRVYDQFRSFVSQKGLDGVIGATLEAGKITIAFPTGVLFPKDSADLTDEGKVRLKTLFEFLVKAAGERVNIRGFTDDAPPGTGSLSFTRGAVASSRAVAGSGGNAGRPGRSHPASSTARLREAMKPWRTTMFIPPLRRLGLWTRRKAPRSYLISAATHALPRMRSRKPGRG